MLSIINQPTNEERAVGESQEERGVEIEGQFNSRDIAILLLSSIMSHLVTISTATPSPTPCVGSEKNLAFKKSQQSVSSR